MCWYRISTLYQYLKEKNDIETFQRIAFKLDYKTPFIAIHVETGYRKTTGHVKVARYR